MSDIKSIMHSLDELTHDIIYSNRSKYLSQSEKYALLGTSGILATSCAGRVLFELKIQPYREFLNNKQWAIGNGFGHGMLISAGFWWGYGMMGKYTDSEIAKVGAGIVTGVALDFAAEFGEFLYNTYSSLGNLVSAASNFMANPYIPNIYQIAEHMNKSVDFYADLVRGAEVAVVLIPLTYFTAKGINYLQRRHRIDVALSSMPDA